MKKTLLTIALLCTGASMFAGSLFSSLSPKKPTYKPNKTHTQPSTAYSKPAMYKNTGVAGPQKGNKKPIKNTMLQFGE